MHLQTGSEVMQLFNTHLFVVEVQQAAGAFSPDAFCRAVSPQRLCAPGVKTASLPCVPSTGI